VWSRRWPRCIRSPRSSWPWSSTTSAYDPCRSPAWCWPWQRCCWSRYEGAPRLTGSVAYPHRVAMISLPPSPLAPPGVGDAGGLNVYVAEVARRLGERGLKVDVFTRAEDPDVDEIVEIHEHTRVISLTAGPREMAAEEARVVR